MEFPSVWIYQGTIFEGNYIDSTMFEYNGRWWLFLWDNHGSNLGSLSIMYTNAGDSPVVATNWHAHALNPVISRSYMRPAGRPVVSDQDITGNGVENGANLYRFVMDNTRTYGERVYMMQITTLTTTSFEEIQLDANGPPAKFLRYIHWATSHMQPFVCIWPHCYVHICVYIVALAQDGTPIACIMWMRID